MKKTAEERIADALEYIRKKAEQDEN